ncbi:MAG: cytochrome c peroxidase, partial [Lewinella sp.]
MSRFLLLFFLFTLFVAGSCEPDPPLPCEGCPVEPQDRAITGPSIPTAFTLEVPDHMPRPIVDETNPLTVEGIELGRRLFYDKIMGRDSSFACADCHLQEKAFTDGRALAIGVGGQRGTRSAMSIVNMAFNPTG